MGQDKKNPKGKKTATVKDLSAKPGKDVKGGAEPVNERKIRMQ